MNLTYFLLNSIKYAKYTLSKNLIFLMLAWISHRKCSVKCRICPPPAMKVLQSYATVIFFPMHSLVILLRWLIFLLMIYRSLDNAEYLFPIDEFPFHFTMFLFLMVVYCLRELYIY